MSGTELRSLVGVALFTFGAAACGGAGPEGEAPGSAASTQSAVRAASPCRQPLPATLVAPAGEELERALDAAGVQIYTCTANVTGAGWVFTAPEATLYANNGRVAGRHYAGPTWEANDGSTVVGARVAGVTVDATAIPWLLLKAASHGGDGSMTEVSSIQRVATVGGLAPSTGCDVTAVGAVARVPYTATYCFHEKED